MTSAPLQATSVPTENLAGLVERVTFHNEENGFCVLRLSCNVNEAAIAAAVDGWGLTQVLSYQVAEAVADGRLEIVLNRFETEPLPIHVVHVEGSGASAKIRAFVDHAVRHLRTDAVLNPSATPDRRSPSPRRTSTSVTTARGG